MSKISDLLKFMDKDKEAEPGKEVQLEKNDFLALCIACASVAVPLLLLFIGAIALFIFAFNAYFG